MPVKQELFVKEDSIVREIWGRSDVILLIFGGASAEFALNKAVDWLYYTGKLPSDPLGRLFSTVEYARLIVFSEMEAANRSIDKITMIHKGVESGRGFSIPDWAYRDVLFMLIDYSIRSYELVVRKMSKQEKEETFDVFNRVGIRMGLKDLPANFDQWTEMRENHMVNDLEHSTYTSDLFFQYKKHLGLVRYFVLCQAQIILVPGTVRKMLGFNRWSLLLPVVPVYRMLSRIKLEGVIKGVLFPPQYKSRIYALDRNHVSGL